MAHSDDQQSSFWDPDAIPAATVLVIRDGQHGVEALMLKRNSKASFAGGMWVFPGGRIDPEDHPESGPDLDAAAQVAAVRETVEESGLIIAREELVHWSHWTPPQMSYKRFTTAFFVAKVDIDQSEVVIDNQEIKDHAWISAEEVLARQRSGELGLTPPTFVTLEQLIPHNNSAEVLAGALAREVEHFATRFAMLEDEPFALYHGDEGYDDEDASLDNPRHRLSMGARWEYVREV